MCRGCYDASYHRQNAERKCAATRSWRESNPERQKQNNQAWRAANADAERTQKRSYRRANRERVNRFGRERVMRRNARKRGGVVTKADYAAILNEHGMVCHICSGGIESVDDLHFDHVIPLAKGGPHNPSNIRPSHALCNRRKGDRLVKEIG
jgi:5-methylcytosine-specific restriction endonuclease McrA